MIEKGIMTADLIEAVQRYGNLEIRLQRAMAAMCRTHCARCEAPCCKAVFCQESLDSPFLALVRKRFSIHAQWDSSRGWLTSGGCSLAAGRPPVCYEFICAAITNTQQSTDHRQALNSLAMLMTNAGRNARGKRHLVELDQLERLNLQRLMVQFSKAEAVLDGLIAFWDL